jgi:hypothetical protein
VTIGSIEQGASGSSLWLTLPGGRRAHFVVEHGDLRIEPATWHPAFGREEATVCLVVGAHREGALVRLAWERAS